MSKWFESSNFRNLNFLFLIIAVVLILKVDVEANQASLSPSTFFYPLMSGTDAQFVPFVLMHHANCDSIEFFERKLRLQSIKVPLSNALGEGDLGGEVSRCRSG